MLGVHTIRSLLGCLSYEGGVLVPVVRLQAYVKWELTASWGISAFKVVGVLEHSTWVAANFKLQ